ncbi:glycerophosphodiester phosphodiesterase [Erythrobacter jejuensis]|uniref:glycerophosphodiester phosphodiesterase n=2 Tax=Parerythrobacter jejuensis TaxID=795812 RepID=A0A845AP34_9SPHN|nr:glycerophosphodiester phosphodiesterase [Parerythrobacter jejuensis]MXP33425.1 glycerophosphodiester phosphodiesterase [Parerythrobacter jejuensis]
MLVLAVPAYAEDDMLIIAHRGASGERPEHTLAAYELAIDQGADYIEPDLVFTKDGVLVSRHENDISATTDVAKRSEFASRKTTKSIDGADITGWFTEDFTLDELKSLRAIERLPDLRPQNTAFDGKYDVPTLAEIIDLVKRKESETGRRIGLYPEMKHPTYFKQATGLNMVNALVAQLNAAGYDTAEDPVFIQSFEVTPLIDANGVTDMRLIQLIKAEGRPWDVETTNYAFMSSAKGLAVLARYADGVGANLQLVLNADGTPTSLVADARAAGMKVHAWTLRKENAFLPPALQRGANPADAGCLSTLVSMLEDAGVDGLFTDDPAPVISALASGESACVREPAGGEG